MPEAVVDIAGYGPIRVDTGEYAPTPAALKQMLDQKFSEFKGFIDTVYKGMRPEDKAALWTTPIPIVGDAVGLYADATMYINDPESRTMANALLSAAGAVPFIPGASTARTVAGESIDKAVETVKKNLNAWHGSPHRFDRFSMSQIGTGEGAQAYGHGLYFAENPDVARSYKDVLAQGNSWNIDGKKYHGMTTSSDATAHNYAANALSRFDGNVDEAIDWLDDFGTEAQAKEILKNASSVSPSTGSLYNVNLNVDPDELLDWDAPLSQQSEKVRNALSEYENLASDTIKQRVFSGELSDGFNLVENADGFAAIADNDMFQEGQRFSNRADAEKWLSSKIDEYAGGKTTGNMIYQQLVDAQGGADYIGASSASNMLKDRGIYGIKYLDSGSRDAAEGTRNFVIFDDSLVDIKSVE